MKVDILDIQGKQCCFYSAEQPEVLIIHPTGSHEIADEEALAKRLLAESPVPVGLLCVPVSDWNKELSPWDAEAVFGNEGFGHDAPKTLTVIEDALDVVMQDHPLTSARTVLGGYSLAGLFALWCGYVSHSFDAVAGVSPSVWFPGWLDFALQKKPKTGAVYLSLGDREEKTRHPVLSQVDIAIRKQHELLTDVHHIPATLEWNQGNHFREPQERLFKGFMWCIRQVTSNEI